MPEDDAPQPTAEAHGGPALEMQPLPHVASVTRLRWVRLLAAAAVSQRMDAPLAFAMARALEHHAHCHRQQTVQVGAGCGAITVLRYGSTDLLLTEPLPAHVDAAAAQYCAQLRRAAWLLSSGGAQEMLSKHAAGKPSLLLLLPDDKVVECTAHAHWEREFYAKQERARALLASGRVAAPTSGIFACPRCASYDVDTEQKQTRSADEPMTIFCTCNSCGKRFIR